MAKKNEKSAAAQAAASQQAAPANKNTDTPDVSLNTIVSAMKAGSLSQDGKAITANLVQKRWVEGENIPEGIRNGAGVIVDAFLGDIIVTSIAQGKSVFSGIIARDENKYLAIRTALATQGISLPEFKALPAPTDEQLKSVGVHLLPSESAVVSVSAENIDKSAIEKKKKELEAVKKAVDNPSEITNNEQLKASLTAMLVKPITEGKDGPSARVDRTIKFYRGYLTIQANKIEDADKKAAAIKEIKEKGMVDLLNEIADIVGSCPFALHGAAYLMRKFVAETGNPLASFCLYRRTAIAAKDGSTDDQYIADIVRTLILWSCKSRISDLNRNIKEAERLIKKNQDIVSKDEKSADSKIAKAAIKKWNEDIDKYKVEMAELDEFIEETAEPSLDDVDALIENYNSKETESEAYKLARRMVDDVMKTFYKDVDRSKVKEASMLANVQQRAGIILNMFRSPLNQNQSYSEANITDLEMVEDEKK